MMDKVNNKHNSFKEFYKRHKKKFSFVYMIVICLIIAKLLTTFVFLSVVVDGSSMSTTLSNGDKGITDGIFYKVFGIDRFDIVIFEQRNYEDKLVKRVIGLPGDKVRYDEGVLYINDEEVKETFLSEEMAQMTKSPLGNDTFEIQLGENQYYVMGDNRSPNGSLDSRYFGPIKKEQIEGVGIMLFAKCKSVSEDGNCSGLRLCWPKIIK